MGVRFARGAGAAAGAASSSSSSPARWWAALGLALPPWPGFVALPVNGSHVPPGGWLCSAGRGTRRTCGDQLSPRAPQTPPVPLPALLPRRGPRRGVPVRTGGAAGAAGRPPGRRLCVPVLLQRGALPASRPEGQRRRRLRQQDPEEAESRPQAQGPRGEWAPAREGSAAGSPAGLRAGTACPLRGGGWRPRLPGPGSQPAEGGPAPAPLPSPGVTWTLSRRRLPAAWI